MTGKELIISEPRQDRIRPGFEQARKVFRGEFPTGIPDGYEWIFEKERNLFEKEKGDMISENKGVLLATGDLRDDPLLLPRIHYPSAQRGSDAVRKRLLLPGQSVSLVQMLDTGKIENREAASTLHSELFLEAARAMLSDNIHEVPVPVDQDLLQFMLTGYFSSVVQRGGARDEIEKATGYIRQITEALQESTIDEFQVIVSGVRSGVLLRGEHLFTQHYGADDIVQKLIGNALLPKYVKGMDQKHIWFRPDAAGSGYALPEFSADDALIRVYDELGSGKDTRSLIRAYISGEVGVRFLDSISREPVRRLREERFRATLEDEAGKEELARRLRTAMISRDAEDQPDYSAYEHIVGESEVDQDFEEDPEIVRRAKFVRNKKPVKGDALEG